MAGLSTPTTSVDLSRLPPPTVVEQLDYEQIRAEWITKVQELFPQFDATVESDPAVKVLEVGAYREMLLRQAFNDRLRQVMVAYASGTNLDQLAVLFGVGRLVLDPGNVEQGIDPTFESDDALRERVVLAPESYTVAGPEAAYVFHARSVDGSIRDASATSPEPGKVLVTILSRLSDGTADDDQLEAVRDRLAVVQGNRLRPLGDEVIVASAEIVPYVIEAQITLYSGPDETVVRTASQVGLASWIAESGKLDEDATRARIIAALVVEGVQNVNLIHPAADVVVNKTQAARCMGVNVTVAGRGD